MPGFRNIGEFADADRLGQTWVTGFRKLVASAASPTGGLIDYLYYAGSPPANFYASSPLVGAVLEPSRGIYVPSVAPATQHVKNLTVMSAAASATTTTNQPDGDLIVSGTGSSGLAVTTNSPALTASINGAGGSTFAIAVGSPILGAIADLIGATSLVIAPNAPIIFPLNDSSPLRTASASFSLSANLQRYAVGLMTGSALPYTELSPQSLAAAVWDAALAEFQQTGSAGKALSTAGAGGVDLAALSGAVVAALQTAVIPVNVKAINGAELSGSGVTGNEWGPA